MNSLTSIENSNLTKALDKLLTDVSMLTEALEVKQFINFDPNFKF
jgi:hypothetical protein